MNFHTFKRIYAESEVMIMILMIFIYTHVQGKRKRASCELIACMFVQLIMSDHVHYMNISIGYVWLSKLYIRQYGVKRHSKACFNQNLLLT